MNNKQIFWVSCNMKSFQLEASEDPVIQKYGYKPVKAPIIAIPAGIRVEGVCPACSAKLIAVLRQYAASQQEIVWRRAECACGSRFLFLCYLTEKLTSGTVNRGAIDGCCLSGRVWCVNRWPCSQRTPGSPLILQQCVHSSESVCSAVCLMIQAWRQTTDMTELYSFDKWV